MYFVSDHLIYISPDLWASKHERTIMAHPYFPRDIVLPHYKPNESSTAEILGVFFGVAGLVTLLTWRFTCRQTTGDRIKICWFVVCGFIHMVLEGYFCVFHATLAGRNTYLAQMWKEYGKGDSRYVISDTFMIAMESITAVIDGPLCFFTAAAFVTKRFWQYRFVLQLIVSLCQLYGDSLFYLTEIIDGFKHTELWDPVNFWFYFFFLNIIWIIVPLVNIVDASTNLIACQRNYDSTKKEL